MTPMTRLRAVGWLHVLLGGAGLVFGSILLFLVATSTDKSSGAGVVIVPIVLFFDAVFFAPAFIGGLGLLRRRAWARVLMIVLSLVELLAVPIGTIVGALGLWVLFARETKALFDAPPMRAASIPSASAVSRFVTERIGVLLAVAGVGAGFVIVIGAGFKISGQQAPAEITALFYPAVVAFVAILVLAARLIAAQRAREHERRDAPPRAQIDDHRGARPRVPFDADRR